MKVVVTGSRDWADYDCIHERLEKLPKDSVIIQGGCRGADSLAYKAALHLGLGTHVMLADWNKFGRRAGPIRNRRMLAEHPDLVIAFCLNSSAGTMDCYNAARAMGLTTELITEHSVRLTHNPPPDSNLHD